MAINAHPKPMRAMAISLARLLLALLLPACTTIRSPTPPKMYIIGVVNFVLDAKPILIGFKEQMAELGYREDDNIKYIYNGPVARDLLDAEVQSLLDQGVNLILAMSTPAAIAAHRATAETQLPVVFVPVTDPVAAGIVESLSHPGGNVTGITNGGSDGRRLEWLLKAAPDIQRVYVPYNSTDASPLSALKDITEAAAKLGVEIVPYEAPTSEEMTEAFATMPDDIDAIFMLPDSLAISHTDDFVQASLDRRLPFSAPTTREVEHGALISFGIDFPAGGRQAARLAAQILGGTSPADLPVETSEFTLAVNLITADAIGLDLPDEVVDQADEIIRPTE